MTNEPREIVRELETGDDRRGLPCCVGHGEDVEACMRPSMMEVYGLPFCGEHGAECADGALEELHQDAYAFFERFNNPEVPELSNPLVRAGLRGWGLAVPEGLAYSEGRTDELLLAAFPFREDRVFPETAGEVADPIEGQDPPYDAWLHHRHETCALMRHAYTLGLDYAVERLEQARETCAAQAAYALALLQGEHPEVIERAHRENLEDAREALGHLARKPA